MKQQQQQENCWKKRNNLEKVLIVIIFILLCFLLCLFIILLVHHGRLFKSATETKVALPSSCTTSQCIQGASQIIDFIDSSIDPCDNFYEFTCGGFIKKRATNEKSSLSKLEAITINKLDALITEPLTEPLEHPLELQRKFYGSCMNTTAIEEDNNDALIDLIVKIGGWPLRQGRLWNSDRFNWLWSMVRCRDLGVGYEYFMRFTGTVATVNGTKLMLLSISPPVIRSNVPSQFRDYYIEVMTNISLQLGATTYDFAKTESNRVLQLEDQIKLFSIYEEQNNSNEIVQLGTLQTQFPDIPWVDLLNRITKTASPFNSNSWISMNARNYLNNLLHLLKNTSKITQANYVIWKIVASYGNYLNEEHRTRYNTFLMSVDPGRDINNRKDFCLKKAKFYFPSVAEIAYVRRHLTPELRKDIKLMIKSIKQVVTNSNRWLNEESSNLNEIEEYVGASDRVYQEKFDNIVDMEGFKLDTDNVVEMSQKLFAKRADNYFKIINKNFDEVTKEALEKSPIFETNAFYMHQFKTLVLSAPFLQGLVYDLGRPKFMNYGALGSVIGHELTHSFLSHKNKESGSGDIMKKYDEGLECFLQEHRNHTHFLVELTGDGRAVLPETLADFIGPNLAYQAYREWVRKHGQEKTLPGFPYTSNQLFWIMFGAIKCQIPKTEDELSFDQEHATQPSFAVSLTVKNSPDFAADFNCPINSKMNPKKKCQILGL